MHAAGHKACRTYLIWFKRRRLGKPSWRSFANLWWIQIKVRSRWEKDISPGESGESGKALMESFQRSRFVVAANEYAFWAWNGVMSPGSLSQVVTFPRVQTVQDWTTRCFTTMMDTAQSSVTYRLIMSSRSLEPDSTL